MHSEFVQNSSIYLIKRLYPRVRDMLTTDFAPEGLRRSMARIFVDAISGVGARVTTIHHATHYFETVLIYLDFNKDCSLIVDPDMRAKFKKVTLDMAACVNESNRLIYELEENCKATTDTHDPCMTVHLCMVADEMHYLAKVITGTPMQRQVFAELEQLLRDLKTEHCPQYAQLLNLKSIASTKE